MIDLRNEISQYWFSRKSNCTLKDINKEKIRKLEKSWSFPSSMFDKSAIKYTNVNEWTMG